MTVRRKVHSCLILKKVKLIENLKKKLRSRYDQFISSKDVAVSWLKCKIYHSDGLASNSRWGGEGVEILLVTPRYRDKPDNITTVLKGHLTCICMQTLLCKIIICLKIPHLQKRQSFCLNDKYINETMYITQHSQQTCV